MSLSKTYLWLVLALAWAFLAEGADAPLPHIITSFESESELRKILPGNARVQVSLAREHATDGENSARVSFPPYDPNGRNWPSAALTLGKTAGGVTDWTPYRRVELDVTNPADGRRELGISFSDQDKKMAGYSYWAIPPGAKITVSFDIEKIAEGIDCSRMGGILFWQRLQVRQPQDRTVFFVDYPRLVPKTLDAAAVRVRVIEPHFRNSLYASHPLQRIRAEVQLDLPKQTAVVQAAAELMGAEGRVVGRKPLKTDGATQTLTFPLPAPLGSRELMLRVRLMTTGGRKLYEKEVPIPIVAAAADEVTVDEQNRLLLNGRPIFPIGIYHASVDDLGLLAGMGFNCVGPYLTATPEYVAEARKHGLRLISNAPKDDDTWVQDAAKSGALLGYYMYDEPEPDRATELREHCLALARRDPYHPTCGCNNGRFEYYTNVADVMMVDAYPHPGKFDVIVDRMNNAVRTMKGRRPVWYIPQAFARIGYMSAGTTLENSRGPTFRELRAATWLGIALGARGVIFYSHQIQTFKIRHAFPLLWRALGHTVAEMRALHDVLLWPMAAVGTSDGNVYAAAFAHEGKRVVVAVNAGLTPTEATLTLSEETAPSFHVLGEGRRLACAGVRLTDQFGPKTAHLYANWAIESPINVDSIAKELADLQAERQKQWRDNVALLYHGASLEASWGFTEDMKRHPWRRMIDGYRGASWPLGTPRAYRYPRAMRMPNQWLDVRLAKPETLDRAVVVTSHSGYEFAAKVGEEGRKLTPVREKRTNDYGPTAIVKTFRLDRLKTDRLRILLPRRGERKREVYRVQDDGPGDDADECDKATTD